MGILWEGGKGKWKENRFSCDGNVSVASSEASPFCQH